MKITRAIREFIEHQVKIKEEQALEPFRNKREDALKRAREEFEEITNEMNAMLNNLLRKYGIKESLRVIVPKPEYHLPEANEYNQKRLNFNDKRKEIIIEIIAEMELGGTKAELMEKINSIKF